MAFIPVHWTDANGVRYEFQVDPIGARYHPRSGVYIFCYLGADGLWKAVYIGETSDFRRRLDVDLVRHHQWDRIRAAGATHIGTLYVAGDRSLRLNIETALCRAIPTPCNLKINWLNHLLGRA